MDGPETMIAVSAIARNSGPFALILLWGPSKSHSDHPRSGPPENIILGRSQPLGSQSACLIQTMNGFHQHPALLPSKKTFTVGKTNTDNNTLKTAG